MAKLEGCYRGGDMILLKYGDKDAHFLGGSMLHSVFHVKGERNSCVMNEKRPST